MALGCAHEERGVATGSVVRVVSPQSALEVTSVEVMEMARVVNVGAVMTLILALREISASKVSACPL